MQTDIYTRVTNLIIEQLEKGVIPWKSPYFSEIGLPMNYRSGKTYSGINIFLLGCLRYTSPHFLTYLQAQELGGQVRNGEKGALVVKYGTYTKEEDKQAAGDQAAPQRKYLKAYTVFNASQIEGIEFPQVVSGPELSPSEKCDKARAIIAAMPKAPLFVEGEAIPCYRPRTDSVHMPEMRYFDSEEGYYSTYFHELIHATGHQSRLARNTLLDNKGIDAAGGARKTYAEEELVAEMGASFLNAEAGISEAELENSAAYLQGWIDALKTNDGKSWIVKAASEAQKAANYILNIHSEAQP